MILNYERPQTTIANNLAVTAAGLASRFRAVAIGPNYRLNRFGQDTIPDGVAFDSSAHSLAYTYLKNGAATALPSTDVVDLDSVGVYGADLEALLVSYNNLGSDTFRLSSTTTPHILKITGTGNTVKGGTLSTPLRGRPVTLGDVAYVNDGVSGLRRRKVIGLQGKSIAAHYGSNSGKDNSQFSNSAYNPTTTNNAFEYGAHPVGKTVVATGTFGGLVKGSKIGDSYGEKFIITVRVADTAASGNARVDISSASGLWNATNVTPTNSSGDYVINHSALAGLTATLDTGSPGQVEVGEVYVFTVKANYDRLTSSSVIAGDNGSGYTGSRDTTYLVTVTKGSAGGVAGAEVSITDTTGVDVIQSDIVIANDVFFPVGSLGLKMKFKDPAGRQAGLRAGDVYYIHAVAPSFSLTEFDKVVFDGPVVDTTVFSDTDTDLELVEFRRIFSGLIAADAAAGGTAWTATATDIDVEAGASLFVDARDASYKWCPFVDGIGTLTPSYRSLIPRPAGGDVTYIENSDQIVDNFGKIDLANDLAFGASEMLRGSQGRGIYVLPVTSNDETGFADALTLLESADIYYALAIISDSLDVFLAAKSHAQAMCQKDVKNFRKAYVGTDSPGTYPVLKLQADGITPYTATISDYSGSNILVTTPDTVDFRTLELAPGDRFLISGTEYKVASVISATELLLQSGPSNAVSPAAPFQLWKADTVASQKAYLNQRAAALGTELVCHIWQESGTRYINGSPTTIPNRYLACEAAGLRSALLPQQGLTRTEFRATTAAPSMYLRYRKGDLDDIAAHGTFIITQEIAGGPIFCRHQLTTETGKGSLYYEDSATVIVHSVDFSTKDIIDPMIGRRNATQATVDLIKNRLIDMLRIKTMTTLADIGPELIGFREITVALHPVLKDRIQVSGILTIPLPLNNVDVIWNGEVSLSA